MVFQLLFPIFEGEVHVQPEEANICIQEAGKFGAECSLSRLEGLGKLKVHSGEKYHHS